MEQASAPSAIKPSLDDALFDLLENNPDNAMGKARLIIEQWTKDHEAEMLRIIFAQANGSITTREEAKDAMGKAVMALVTQVLKQLGGYHDGLIVSREKSGTLISWICCKLGDLRKARRYGILSNIRNTRIRAQKRQARRVELFDEKIHCESGSDKQSPLDSADLNNSTARHLWEEAVQSLQPHRAWLVELWIISQVYGITTAGVIEVGCNTGIKRRPAVNRVRKVLKNFLRARGYTSEQINPDKTPIFQLSYNELAEIGSLSRSISISTIQKLMAELKSNIRQAANYK